MEGLTSDCPETMEEIMEIENEENYDGTQDPEPNILSGNHHGRASEGGSKEGQKKAERQRDEYLSFLDFNPDLLGQDAKSGIIVFERFE